MIPPPAGDPSAIGVAAARFMRLAGELETSGQALTRVAGDDDGWRGIVAVVMHGVLATRPDRLLQASAAARATGRELGRHAGVLAEAHHLHRQARAMEAHNPTAAGQLATRAIEMATESARSAAARIDQVAGEAPHRPGLLSRVVGATRAAMSEVELGTAEALTSIGDLVTRFGPKRQLTDPLGELEDAQGLVLGLVKALGDPVESGKVVLDWDTWRTNPFRAVGHLVPDVVTAVATAGASATGRAATAATRASAQFRVNAANNLAERTARAEQAALRRQEYLRQTQKESESLDAPAWTNEDGAHLTPEQNAYAEAYYRAVTQHEKTLTTRIQEIGAELGDDAVVGLHKRLKEPDSLKRKIANKAGSIDGVDLEKISPQDVARYTLVVPEEQYIAGTHHLAARLGELGLHMSKFKNAWADESRYRGVNTAWVDPDIGVAFEVQVHTPSSWAATQATHDDYKILRKPTTDEARKAEVEQSIADEYAKAPLPPGILGIDGGNVHPVTGPMPPPHVPQPRADELLGAAIGGGLAAVSAPGEVREGAAEQTPTTPPR